MDSLNFDILKLQHPATLHDDGGGDELTDQVIEQQIGNISRIFRSSLIPSNSSFMVSVLM